MMLSLGTLMTNRSEPFALTRNGYLSSQTTLRNGRNGCQSISRVNLVTVPPFRTVPNYSGTVLPITVPPAPPPIRRGAERLVGTVTEQFYE